MVTRQRQARWNRPPISGRGGPQSHMDTTAHQVTARIRSTRETIAAGQAQLATLTGLREVMRAAGAQTIGELSLEMRARRREPIRATAGTIGGVEMW